MLRNAICGICVEVFSSKKVSVFATHEFHQVGRRTYLIVKLPDLLKKVSKIHIMSKYCRETSWMINSLSPKSLSAYELGTFQHMLLIKLLDMFLMGVTLLLEQIVVDLFS